MKKIIFTYLLLTHASLINGLPVKEITVKDVKKVEEDPDFLNPEKNCNTYQIIHDDYKMIMEIFKLKNNNIKFFFVAYRWPNMMSNIKGRNIKILDENTEAKDAKRILLQFWIQKQKPVLAIKKKQYKKYADVIIKTAC